MDVSFVVLTTSSIAPKNESRSITFRVLVIIGVASFLSAIVVRNDFEKTNDSSCL